MCGIAGIFSTRGNLENTEISSMASDIQRRGPDKSAIKISENHHAAFSRLSIVDLDDRAMQPMLSANKRLQISFNGEIYNRHELKQSLKYETRSQLTTTSDTEIFLEYISEYGLDRALNDAEGMFGFSLQDLQKNELYLCVDKFGQKPIYYGCSDKGVYYSSDFKSLVNLEQFKQLDIAKVSEYFSYGHISAPDTLIINIKKIEAGTYTKFSSGSSGANTLIHTRYFCIESDIKFFESNASLQDLKENFENTINEMTDIDVDYACFLSGGVDSSMIAAALKNLKGNVKTYCISFPGTEYDESEHASKVARFIGSEHRSIEIPKEKMIKIIKSYPDYFAEPMVDFASIPLIFASSEIDEKVAFVGDGGDELYGGYHDYYNTRRELWNKKRTFDYKKFNLFKSFLPLKLQGVLSRAINKTNNHKDFMKFFHSNEGLYDERLSKTNFSSQKPLDREYKDFSWLQDITIYSYSNKLQNQFLPKLDRSSMGNGKELRAPFLNLKHLKFKFENFGINFNNRKLQKELLSLYIDPEITDRPKKGFSIPFEDWLRNDLYNWAEELIKGAQISSDIIDKDYLLSRLRFHKLRIFDDSNILWKALNFLNWIRLYNIKE